MILWIKLPRKVSASHRFDITFLIPAAFVCSELCVLSLLHCLTSCILSIYRSSSCRSASRWMAKPETLVVEWCPLRGARARSQWTLKFPSQRGKTIQFNSVMFYQLTGFFFFFSISWFSTADLNSSCNRAAKTLWQKCDMSNLRRSLNLITAVISEEVICREGLFFNITGFKIRSTWLQITQVKLYLHSTFHTQGST